MALRQATERMTLDVSRLEVQTSLAVTQGDTMRRWEIKLTDRGQPIEIGKRWTAALSGIKPDGKVIYNGCTAANGRIVYDFASGTEIATAAGAYELTLEVYDEAGEILHAPKIWLNVLKNRNRDIASEDQFKAAQEIIARLNSISKEFDERVEIPTFVLEDFGIPEIKIPAGNEIEFAAGEADTTELAEALSRGNVRFLVNLSMGSVVMRDYGIIMNGVSGLCHGLFLYAANPEYTCVLNIMVVEGRITAYISRIPEFVDQLPEKINDMEKSISDLLYAKNPLTIVSFANNIGTVEIGSTVKEVTLSWKLNRMPATVQIGGVAQTPAETGTFTPEDGKNLKLTSPGSKTWELVATHEMDETSKRSTTSVVFANRVYYTGLPEPAEYTSSFVTNITESVLRTSKPTSIKTYAERDEYVYYCQPVRLGKCVFSFGANEGGFSLVATIPVTNKKGYTEDYYIYRSDEKGLGDITLGVK